MSSQHILTVQQAAHFRYVHLKPPIYVCMTLEFSEGLSTWEIYPSLPGASKTNGAISTKSDCVTRG
jgi:hypothetical protein